MHGDNISAIFELTNISKLFFGVYALKDVSISIEKDKVTGLVGGNGAGKTTLMNIIGGVLQPDKGTLSFAGKKTVWRDPYGAFEAGISFIHQELNLFNNLTVAENLYISNFPTRAGRMLVNQKKIQTKTTELLKTLELDFSSKILVEKLTPGERQMVEVAKALSGEAKIIIFDEPTTSLTDHEKKYLFDVIRRLKRQGTTILYISHILDEVRELSDRIVVLKDGEVTDKLERDEFDLDRIISGMVGSKLERLYPLRSSKPGKEIIFKTKAVTQKGTVKDIDVELYSSEILGIFGLMGSGRSELARILFGVDKFETGEIFARNTKLEKHTPRDRISIGMAFITEDRHEEGLLLTSTVFDNILLASIPQYAKTKLLALNNKELIKPVQKKVTDLQIKTGEIKKQEVKSLSGGNQQKVVLAKWLMSNPYIFIADEPTRGIDIGAKYEIYKILDSLAKKGSGILFISSEIEELIAMCDRILVMRGGEIVNNFSRKDKYDEEQIMRSAFGH